jgi:predicted nucleic acid binding AN1-type Zn finger protein
MTGDRKADVVRRALPKLRDSICDYCARDLKESEAQSCERCGGVYCEHHIGELDHACDPVEEP